MVIQTQRQIESWGRLESVSHPCYFLDAPPQDLSSIERAQSVLPFGEGRSYGDSCLNKSGCLLLARGMNHFIEFNEESGLLTCEAGVRLDEILEVCLPRGWFVPVTPGTQFVTVGGAIANDIHGKNHHVAGTFGCFIKKMEVLRSEEGKMICSPTENPDLFRATIGGLGLTGLILWAQIQMKKVQSPLIDHETIRFSSLRDFFKISEESERDYEYSVSWIDTLAQGKNLGRGHFMRGNHSLKPSELYPPLKGVRIPFDAPSRMLNSLTVRAFNFLYYHKQLKKKTKVTSHYRPFFYPLDALFDWNRLYGKRGFFQYQLVVPYKNDLTPLQEILKLIAKTGLASFLAVLKTFGSVQSPGLLSFPREGVTLALDFPNQGEKTLKLFRELDRIVRQSGGALYPAKDATMSSEDFKAYYPRWKEFEKFKDPLFSSSFWRRVTETKRREALDG